MRHDGDSGSFPELPRHSIVIMTKNAKARVIIMRYEEFNSSNEIMKQMIITHGVRGPHSENSYQRPEPIAYMGLGFLFRFFYDEIKREPPILINLSK